MSDVYSRCSDKVTHFPVRFDKEIHRWPAHMMYKSRAPFWLVIAILFVTGNYTIGVIELISAS